MPMFDFYCPKCQNVFEELVFDDDEVPPCPKCGEEHTERRVSAPSPLKTGAFPFKIGPVHPIMKTPAAQSPCHGNCSGACSCATPGNASGEN